MKKNVEIRSETKTLLKTHWFWRLVYVGLLLNFIAQGVSGVLGYLFKQGNITTWMDFAMSRLEHLKSGLELTVPSSAQAWQMTGASAFQLFVAYIFGAILAFGLAQATLCASRNKSENLIRTAFGGFRRPLELAGLLLAMNLSVTLQLLLFVFPGIIALYRYRLAWYLKGEHPDWSAFRCLGESGRLMKGHKWQAFALDASYVWMLIPLSFVFAISLGLSNAAQSGNVLLGLAALLIGFAAIYALLRIFCALFVSRAVFYGAVIQENPVKEEPVPCPPAA